MIESITLAHGSGGSASRELMRNVFLRELHNPELEREGDAALLTMESVHIAFTTDNFTVSPLFFNGGDLGKMAVCGTVNDLAVSGAEPKYLAAGFIIEDGFALKDLERIVKSMSKTAFECGMKVVATDVKVVEKGKGDGIYINTTGIGIARPDKLSGNIEPGDKLIVSGTLGEHELAVILERKNLRTPVSIASDCAPLNALTRTLLEQTEGIKLMKDLSRGGLLSALYKAKNRFKYGVILQEDSIPLKAEVKDLCRLLGLNALYLANQGKLMAICDKASAPAIIQIMKQHPLGREAAVIGEITAQFADKVVLHKATGEEIILSLKIGSESYRIC